VHRAGRLLALIVALGTTAVRADEPLAEENVGLGLDAAAVTAEADGGRTALLAGLPGALVRSAPIAWGTIEPAPPKERRPAYRWEALDERVRAWQEAGLAPVLVLTPESPWASQPAEACDWPQRVRAALQGAAADAVLRATQSGLTPPRPDAWAHWERFVEELVERYDGDGILDARGLRRPVRHVQVLEGAQTPDRWLGSADDYLRLLHHAESGAHRASETLRIVHAAVDFHGLGRAPFPDAEEMLARRRKYLVSLPEAARLETERALELSERTLEMTRLFRVVAVAGRGHLADEEADVRYVRGLLDARGARHVDVWLVASPARKLDAARVPGAGVPDRGEETLRRRWLPVAGSPGHGDHARALPWLRRGVAYDLVRAATTARLAGAKRAFLASLSDPPRPEDVVVDAPSGPDRAPSWYAARQWVRRTAGSHTVREIAAGSAARAVVFEYPPSRAPRWEVVLLRDPNRSWAGDPAGETPPDAVTLRLPDGTYDVEETALEDGAPPPRRMEARGGMLTLSVGPSPVYVVPVEVRGGSPP
jgi:hypothetical protein